MAKIANRNENYKPSHFDNDMETKLFLTKEGQSALIDAIKKQPYEVKYIETNQKSDFEVVDFDRMTYLFPALTN